MKHSVRSITSVWTVLVIVMCVRAETRVGTFKYEQPPEIPSSFGINAQELSNYVEIIHCFNEFAGFRPHVSFMPDHRIGIVVLVNESNESTFFPDLVAADIYDHLLSKKPLHVDPNPRVRRFLNELQKEREALAGSEEDRGPARIQMSAGPNAYTGTFESDELGKIVVGFDGNKLHATFGSLSSQLAHQSAETFSRRFQIVKPGKYNLQGERRHCDRAFTDRQNFRKEVASKVAERSFIGGKILDMEKSFGRCTEWFAVAAICLLVSSSYSQTPASSSGVPIDPKFIRMHDLREAGNRAVSLVDRAVRAVGGQERLEALESIGLDFDADVAATYQGPSPKDPHRVLSRSGDLLMDLSRSRLLTTSETRWPNFNMNAKLLYRDGKTYTLDDQAKTYRAADDNEVYEAWALRLMPVVLKRLKNNPTSSFDGGIKEVKGKQYDVVISSLGTTRVYQVYLSRETGLPEIIEHLDYSSDFGDMIIRRTFADFANVAGVLIPMVVKMSHNDHEVFAYRLKNITANPSGKQPTLDLPDGYHATKDPGNAPKMHTRSLGNDVYLIENLAGRDYNVMFADLGESLIIFEAPIDLWASKMALAEIRKVFPQKPVRYVMVSHFHDDHAAGVRTYMAQGATVITTPGNKAYFEEVAVKGHNFHTENRLLHVAEPKFEIVQNKSHEIRRRAITIRFLDLGPTPHVDENIVAYIPELQLLFQGDFFRVPADRTRPERMRDEGVVLFQKIKEKGLVVKHLVGVHGPIGDVSDLEKSHALRAGGN